MDIPNIPAGKKRVVIVGGGFAGVRLAKKLAQKYFQVILIDKNNYHQFQPLLYQVATAGLEPSSISFPLRKIFQQYKNVLLRVAEVQQVNERAQTIQTSAGEIAYDYLVLANGATTNFFGNDALKQNAFTMKSVSEALLLRNTLLSNYEKALTANTEDKQALLNVVVVGGGPTGVELAGAIAEMRNKILPKDYSEIDFGKMHIYLVEAVGNLLSAMSTSSSAKVQEYLKKMGVEVLAGIAVKNYDGKNILLTDGNILQSRCLVWAAGVKGFSFPGIAANALAPNGRVLVNEYNAIIDTKNIFSIGDAALMQTEGYPKGHPQVAPVAIQQATLLANNLENLILKKALRPFVYRDKGTMATVGKNKAVAEIGKLKMKGFFAWFTWMAVHLMSIIGVKNRLFIFINWLWQYFTYDQSLRLIITPSAKKEITPFIKSMAAILVLVFFISCQQPGETKNNSTENAQKEMIADTVKENDVALTLNNGAKWKADSITNINVGAIKNIFSNAKPASLEAYHQTAIQIQEAINTLIKDCRMQGTDHEALHHWLEPIIEADKKLTESTTAEEAQSIFTSIADKVANYSNYFQ